MARSTFLLTLDWQKHAYFPIRPTKKYWISRWSRAVTLTIYHSQGERFARIGNLTGALLFVAFLKFPLIRVQPGFRRVGLSGALAYPFYWYLHNLATKLKVKRSRFFVSFSKIRLSKTIHSTQRSQESNDLITLNSI